MKWTGPNCVAARLLAMGVIAFAGCGGDGDACELIAISDEVETAPAGAALEVAVACVDAGGTPRAGEAVIASVMAGGGGLVSGAAVAGADGRAGFTWSMGVVPVDQRLVIRRAAAAGEPGPGNEVVFTVRATLDEPYVHSPFGNVEDVLAGAGIVGTTEGLALSGAELVLAVPGHLVQVDPQGQATLKGVTGDPLDGPLGLAFDEGGLLWVADSTGHALRTVDADGVVVTVLTTDGEQPRSQPNDVKIGPDGAVWLSDPCLGEILRYDPVTQTVQVVATFDLDTQGGPNGLAFDAEGALWATTENVGLLCMNGDVDMLAPVAGLYRIDPAWAQEADLAARARPILEGVALFGDGLAFDAEGNLYALFDRIDTENLVLESSELHVMASSDIAAFLAQVTGPAEAPRTTVVLSSQDVVMANLAWGRGEFESNRIHLSLLAIPAFGLTTRGVVTFDAGIPGA